MSLTVGIDPGLSGALALLDSYGVLLDVVDMPVIDKAVSAPLLSDLLSSWDAPDGEVGMAVIEQVNSMPKQGVASSFRFGQAYGCAAGVVGGLRLPMHLVRPAKWKREAGLGSDKDRARRIASERWPSKAELFRRKKDHGRAEAALLALWWLERGDRA